MNNYFKIFSAFRSVFESLVFVENDEGNKIYANVRPSNIFIDGGCSYVCIVDRPCAISYQFLPPELYGHADNNQGWIDFMRRHGQVLSRVYNAESLSDQAWKNAGLLEHVVSLFHQSPLSPSLAGKPHQIASPDPTLVIIFSLGATLIDILLDSISRGNADPLPTVTSSCMSSLLKFLFSMVCSNPTSRPSVQTVVRSYEWIRTSMYNGVPQPSRFCSQNGTFFIPLPPFDENVGLLDDMRKLREPQHVQGARHQDELPSSFMVPCHYGGIWA